MAGSGRRAEHLFGRIGRMRCGKRVPHEFCGECPIFVRMKRILFVLCVSWSAVAVWAQPSDSLWRTRGRCTGATDVCGAVQVGMTDTAAYFPLLRGRRVAVLANHTAVAERSSIGAPAAAGSRFEAPGRSQSAAAYSGAGGFADRASEIRWGCGSGVCGRNGSGLGSRSASAGPGASDGRLHLVDLLHACGFDVRGIFAPEHGFRGTADAGEAVPGGTDAATGIPVLSLYDGRTLRPSPEAMRSFDVLVVDMQDVGLRFYTYYIAMLRMMDACADSGREVIVLDRPNPNGHHVDGPVLDMRYESGVGALPVPVLHGLTMGEIARMAVGEGWCGPCALTVVRCRGYARDMPYALPVAPSPNLPTQRSVYLYPSLGLFERTVVSVGRGTEKPFELYGHPDLKGYAFSFVPRPTAGAGHPPFEGMRCYGEDLSAMPEAEARTVGLNLEYLVEVYRKLGIGERFFTPMFEKLVGVDWVREMIVAGASAEEIRARWQGDVERFRRLRSGYLLYE